MTIKKDNDISGDVREKAAVQGRETISRREFAKTSVVAGAAAVAMPNILSAQMGSDTEPPPAGDSASTDENTAWTSSNGWREGTTIPAEYYVDAEHYKNDERYIGENFWLMADHVSRIPVPGDYFVFKYGLGESVIVVRDESGDIRAFNNVCRHRGSRLCRHDEDPKPSDERLSVRQLGESGNAQFFRCPYHAWLYDLDGSLIDASNVHDDFDMADNGLVPCHMRIEEGHIFLNFSHAEEPPEFGANSSFGRLSEVGKKYSLADLKVAIRQQYPIRANWKLAIENFLECYHCGASHKHLVTTHNWDYTLTPSQKRRRLSQMTDWLGESPADDDEWAYGGGPFGGELNPGFTTGSLDGKPLAPLLPGFDDWTHDTEIATTDHSTGYWQAYDDHVAVARFTPRGPELTDCEIFWLVHPDAVEGKDYDPQKVMALWDITIKEDIWIVENNHLGVKSGAYAAGRYSRDENSPSNFVTWYMQDVVKA